MYHLPKQRRHQKTRHALAVWTLVFSVMLSLFALLFPQVEVQASETKTEKTVSTATDENQVSDARQEKSSRTDTKKKTEKEKFDNWQAVGRAMGKEFDEVKTDVEAERYLDAHEHMNTAYFRYYETQGFEASVMNFISRKRVSHIEGLFRDIKHSLLGNQSSEKKSLLEQIDLLKFKVYRDALILDGVLDKNAPDEAGKAILDNTSVKVDEGKANWATFITSFVLMVREGLEAILVVVAIIAYLVKTKNQHLIKRVYQGMLVAILASFALAFAYRLFVGGVGAGQELIEGLTMFLAVAILFYVSNWTLSKADEAAFEAYVHGKVESSIQKSSQWTLVFAAFIAVFREGAELVLFYQASFADDKSNPLYIFLGLLAGFAFLAVVWLIFRYTAVRLPLKPFFLFTSGLLFLLCISFVGKGVQELTEAGVISGATTLPFMQGFSLPDLGIFDRAETLLPQFLLLVAAVWIYLSHRKTQKRRLKLAQKAKERGEELPSWIFED